MFHLFGKKENFSEADLAECQRKQDWAGLAKTCYHLGVDAMERGELNRAHLWLHRADTIYSADDDTYEKVGDKVIDDCGDRIGTLEEKSLLYNDVPAQIAEKAGDMWDAKVRIWGLLSLARLVKLGERLSALPGCEVLGKLGWAVDTILKSFQGQLMEREFNELRNLCDDLYQFGDDSTFWGAGSEIAVPGGAPFQVFDLNGLMGVHLEIDAYVDSHLKMMCALGQEEQPPSPETGIIACGLLPDYYVRNGAGKLEEVPQIKAELARIWSDHEFACSDITWEEIGERIAGYRELDILAL